ncbi:MAG: AI-2E family transporter [Betaproteobacteria bacterium]|nr:AI-2E family transporter [Betaproteobacteria bacterium]
MLVGLIYALSDILAPFVAGLLLGYLGHPLVDRLNVRWLPRSLAALLIVLALIGLGSSFLLLLLPLLTHDLMQLASRLPNSVEAWQAAILPYLPTTLDIDWMHSMGTWRDLLQQHLGALSEPLQHLALSARYGSSLLLHLFLTLLLVPVVTFYLLKDWNRLVASLHSLIPENYFTPIAQLGQEIDEVLGQFLRGQVLVMGTMALFYGLALQIAGVSSGLTLGVTTGLLVFIPYVGVFIGFVLTLLSTLIQNPHLVPYVLAIFLTGHMLEGWVITPRLVGERIGLHPVVVILALLSFGQLLGFLGVVIALPAAAVGRICLSHLLIFYRDRCPISS